MFKEEITWYNVKRDGLPQKDGYYLVASQKAQYMALVSYSTKHRAFNCVSSDSKAEAERTMINVDYWAEKPEALGV